MAKPALVGVMNGKLGEEAADSMWCSEKTNPWLAEKEKRLPLPALGSWGCVPPLLMNRHGVQREQGQSLFSLGSVDLSHTWKPLPG